MTHTTIATIQANDVATVVARLKTLSADAAEVRLDALWPTVPDAEAASDTLSALRESTDLPVIATLRPRRQGGAFDGDETVRVNLLAAAGRAGFHVDLEADLQGLPVLVSAMDTQVTLSSHLPNAPPVEQGLTALTAMQDARATHHKLAWPIERHTDYLRALELAHVHAHRTGSPVITPMGTTVWERLLLALVGNRATYTHHDDETPAAPGQPSITELHDAMTHWGLTTDELGAPRPWFAVLGDPVAHSLSPRIHNALLRHAGRNERFGALRVPNLPGNLLATLVAAPRMGLMGASITTPWKGEAARLCKGDATVKATEAANCIRIRPGRIEATNTDATAIERLIQNTPGTVAILGAGGAGRAAAWACRGRKTTIINRDEGRGRHAARIAGGAFTPWRDRRHVKADIWIQATSAPEAVKGTTANGASLVIDLVYKDQGAPTSLAANCPIIDGRAFLVEQARDAYRFWTGEEPDPTVMAAALGPGAEATV